MDHSELREALKALIRGDGVRRASHALMADGSDVSPLFLNLLAEEGYSETLISGIDVKPGERVPAFYLADGTAHFGWVFWEMFSPDRKRKIFGSHAKNAKGDWAIVRARDALVYACLDRKEPMDAERPSSL